ncbi:MAG: hypothetical protein WAV48_01955, partial [Candidatus Magasanikiibacteriota bacterium]
MALNLGKNLPIASSAGLGSKVSKTPSLYPNNSENLKKNNAKTSIFDNKSQAVISVSRLNNASSAPVSSISRINSSDNRPTTSINRQTVVEVGETDVNNQEADNRRYNYVRRLIKARQQKTAEAEVESPYTVGASTGKGFRTHGKFGILRKMHHLRKKYPLVYKHWGDEEKQYLKDLIKPRVEAVRRNEGMGRSMKRK